jgi:hypothetical protein
MLLNQSWGSHASFNPVMLVLLVVITVLGHAGLPDLRCCGTECGHWDRVFVLLWGQHERHGL